MTSAVDFQIENPAAPHTSLRRGSLRPTLNDVWLTLALGVPTLFVLLSSLNAIDLAYHLRLGESILASGAIPKTDSFTFTAFGSPWLNQQWLAQVGLHSAHRFGGFGALIVLRALLVAAIAATLFGTCRSRGAGARTSALVTMGGCVMALPYLALRPQLFGAVLFGLVVFLVASRHEGSNFLLAVPLLTVVWANVHGSFVLAPMIVSFALFDDLHTRRSGWRRSGLVLVFTLLATCVTPWGAGVWRYAVALISNDTIRDSIKEWSPPSFATASGTLFLIGVVVMIVWLGHRTDRLPALNLAWIAAFTLLALTAHRNILWWAIAVPPLLVSRLRHPSSHGADRGSTMMNVIVVAVIGSAIVAALPWWRPPSSLVTGKPSTTLMAEIDESVAPGSNVLVYQPWASWIEFDRPDMRVFVDSRIEVFGSIIWRDYYRVIGGEDGWPAILDGYEVDAVVVTRDETVVIDRLSHDPDWNLAILDDAGAVFTRGDA